MFAERRFAFLLSMAASLAVHAVVLFLFGAVPKKTEIAGEPAAPPLPLRLTLQHRTLPADSPTTLQGASQAPAQERQEKASLPPTTASRVSRAERRDPIPAADGTPEQATENRSEETAAGKQPAPVLDMESLRRQARELKPEQRSLVRGREAFPAPPAESSDRPALEALARHLGQPADGIREEVLADGSRRIRFRGGACLRIPRFLPLGMESQTGPTVLLPETCGSAAQ